MPIRNHDDPTRTTPMGMARYSHEFLEAAFAVDDRMGNKSGFKIMAPVPALYLIGHGCELALKAYLLHRGMQLKEIRSKIGHDLEAALTQARALGLDELAQLQEGEGGAFELLNNLYAAKELEYIITGAKTVPTFGLLKRAAVRLFNPISKEIGYAKQFDGYQSY